MELLDERVMAAVHMGHHVERGVKSGLHRVVESGARIWPRVAAMRHREVLDDANDLAPRARLLAGSPPRAWILGIRIAQSPADRIAALQSMRDERFVDDHRPDLG
jgi:hypothetical protein